MRYSSYYLYRKYEKRGNQGVFPVVPTTYSIDGDGTMPKVLHIADDPSCSEIPPQYRWVDMDVSIYYICDTETNTKYYKQKEQVSYDNGLTWADVYPAQYQRGSVYEYDSVDCEYMPKPTPSGYSLQYLTVVAEEPCEASIGTNGEVYRSTDNGATWSQFFDTVSLNTGDKLLLKGWEFNRNGSYPFRCNGKFHLEGNAMSFIKLDNFVGETEIIRDNTFYRLFAGCTGLTSIQNLVMPATKLGFACYEYMFSGCTNLTKVPSNLLPATSLNYSTDPSIEYGGGCYFGMFKGCRKLTAISNDFLPATKLSRSCYKEMFEGCTSLRMIPELPSTALAYNCYGYMFKDCTSLTTVHPNMLPATTLVDELNNGCYEEMFRGCTSLTTAPELPATTLGINCYRSMFSGCTSLTTAPTLSATTMKTGCYLAMFANCESLTTAPSLPTANIGGASNSAYTAMFSGCTSLTTAPSVLPATSVGEYGYSNMFRNCTSLATAPTISATSVDKYSCSEMFKGCTSLTTAPSILPATTLGYARHCYDSMFYGCSGLTRAPELPAIDIVDASDCYDNMFRNCSSLNYIKCLARYLSAGLQNVTNWVNGVAASGLFIKNEISDMWTTGVDGIPSGWTVILNNTKWLATYTGGTTSSAECDASSAISQNEITLTDLASVEIGDCVTSIGYRAFYQCSSLSSIAIHSGVTNIGNYAFWGCTNLTSIVIPDSVTSIGNSVFNSCSGLTSVTIGSGVTSISDWTFYNCTSLTNITIPSGVTSIGMGAFKYCSNLSSITVNAITPPTLSYEVFDNTNNCPLLVPASSVEAYKTANRWSDYASRIQAIP